MCWIRFKRVNLYSENKLNFSYSKWTQIVQTSNQQQIQNSLINKYLPIRNHKPFLFPRQIKDDYQVDSYIDTISILYCTLYFVNSNGHLRQELVHSSGGVFIVRQSHREPAATPQQGDDTPRDRHRWWSWSFFFFRRVSVCFRCLKR